MKVLLLLFLMSSIGYTKPRVQFECSIWSTKSQVPDSFRILTDDSTKQSFIQFGDSKSSRSNPFEPIEMSEDGPSVNYQNRKVWIGLLNRGGTAGRWDGNIRFNNRGQFYDGNDSVYDVSCEIK